MLYSIHLYNLSLLKTLPYTLWTGIIKHLRVLQIQWTLFVLFVFILVYSVPAWSLSFRINMTMISTDCKVYWLRASAATRKELRRVRGRVGVGSKVVCWRTTLEESTRLTWPPTTLSISHFKETQEYVVRILCGISGVWVRILSGRILARSSQLQSPSISRLNHEIDLCCNIRKVW